jgi:RNA polymerase sigma-70 factor (ECF subfamily)
VTDDADLLQRLRAGDEAAFAALVDRLHPSLLRVARLFVRSDAVAEEVVQETWVAVLDGLDRFEGRASLNTWIGRILANRARTRAVREGRSLPLSAIEGDGEPAVDRDRFGPRGFWATPPRPWEDPGAEKLLLRRELGALLARELVRLPEAQRAVVELRDVDGWTAEEVCNVLDLSETNQRVLLHRGRSRLRAALERHLQGG